MIAKKTSIAVDKISDTEFNVVVTENEDRSEYTVFIDDEYYEELTGGCLTRLELLKRSFAYMRKNGSEMPINNQFDLCHIRNYYPEYEEDILL